ncbi:nuclease-related domain-containing protein [Bacillaceae bacterium W0354]
MIVKNIELPMSLLQLACLSIRLDEEHIQFHTINEEYTFYHSGYRGEKSLIYYLKSIDSPNIFIIPNVRLKTPSGYFQVDALILTPWFILIIEVKNFTGVVRFDHGFGQMFCEIKGVERAYQDPIVQVDNQVFHLQNWLITKGITGIPIESLVVFTSNHVTLTRSGDMPVDERIIYVGKLIEKFVLLQNKYEKLFLTKSKLTKVANMIKNEHTPQHSNMMKKFNLTPRDLRPGVICSQCLKLPMRRIHGMWLCSFCNNKSKNAHLNAFKDFYLLFKPTITNREARWLLQVNSAKVVNSLLKQLAIRHENDYRYRKYFFKYDLQMDYNYLFDYKNMSKGL